MFVKPGPHPDQPGALRNVRIPHTHALLKDEGEDVPDTPFWIRRLRDGDVVAAEPPKASAVAGEHAEPALAAAATDAHAELAPAPAATGERG